MTRDKTDVGTWVFTMEGARESDVWQGILPAGRIEVTWLDSMHVQLEAVTATEAPIPSPNPAVAKVPEPDDLETFNDAELWVKAEELSIKPKTGEGRASLLKKIREKRSQKG